MARRVGERGWATTPAGGRAGGGGRVVPLVAGTAADGVRVSHDQIPRCGATVSPTGYCADVRNAGPAAATRVTGAVTLPQGLEVTAAPGGTVGGNGRSVAYLVPNSPAGTASTVTVTVTADRTVTGPRTLDGAVTRSRTRI